MTFERVKLLYNALRSSDTKFDPSKYMWRIGLSAMYEIMRRTNKASSFSRTEMPTLFDIKVEINRCNPDDVQLFKNITDELGGNTND